MTYQPIASQRTDPDATAPSWLPVTLRNNALVLSRERGLGGGWIADRVQQLPPYPVSSHPDHPIAWPMILRRSVHNRVLRAQVVVADLVDDVEFAIWAQGQQSAWQSLAADEDGIVEVAVSPTDGPVLAAVVFRSVRGTVFTGVTATIEDLGLQATYTNAGPHQLIEGDDVNAGPFSAWAYSGGGGLARLWNMQRTVGGSRSVDLTELGNVVVQSVHVWWAEDAGTLPVPVLSDIGAGQIIRARNVRQIAASVDAVCTRGHMLAIGGCIAAEASAIGTPIDSAAALAPCWSTIVKPGGVTIVGEYALRPGASEVTVDLGYVTQDGLTMHVVAGDGTVLATEELSPASGTDRRVASGEGTAYRLLAVQTVRMGGGIHSTAGLDILRMGTASARVVPVDDVIRVAVTGIGVVACCSVWQSNDAATPDPVTPMPLLGVPIVDGALAAIRVNDDRAFGNVLRVHWSARAVFEPTTQILRVHTSGELPPGCVLRVTTDAADITIDAELYDEDGSTLLDSGSNVHTTASVQSADLAISGDTSYRLIISVGASGGSPLWVSTIVQEYVP